MKKTTLLRYVLVGLIATSATACERKEDCAWCDEAKLSPKTAAASATAVPARNVVDKTLYFCCESCAEYFMANQASILAARGIAT